MYCPKCKQTFEEGSRRFCPTDGARLISDAPQGAATRREGGIFANLIPKIEGLHDLDETLRGTTPFGLVEPAADMPSAAASGELDEIFFELDDIKPDLDLDLDSSEFLKPIEPAQPEPVVTAPIAPAPVMAEPVAPEPVAPEPRPVARKINPYEIPAGHVDLGLADRAPGLTADFDEADPEGFVGRVVKGRYKVTEFLGGDEAGLAYLADDKIVEDKKVLVRILLAEEQDEIMRSILAEERVALSHLSHPNVARLIDSGQFTGGTNFLVSEYIDALSAGDILSIHGQFSGPRAARVVRQAANALNEAHQEGILHRDVRPENLIVHPGEGDVEQTTLVNFGASNGVPTERNIAYKAPEALDGRIATAASDVFSLAVVAYEMLAGRLPFSGTTAKEIVRSQYAGLQNSGDARKVLPRGAYEVLEKALSFNAVDRYPKARDFGDALYGALTGSEPEPEDAGETRSDAGVPLVTDVPAGDIEQPPVVPAIVARPAAPPAPEPAWKNRSPEPPKEENSRTRMIALGGILVLVALVAAGWYFVVNNPPPPDVPAQAEQTGAVVNTNSHPPANTEMPPLPRNMPQPPNTNFYQNSKQNLKGDLLRNFVGFTIFYPRDWKVNGPQESVTANGRGKFIDISRSTTDDRLKEQMLISYYPSKGTFAADSGKYAEMVKETNDTLKKLLPGYQVVSEGEIKINGDWRAYEVKFQGGGTSPSGEKLVVWGRRLFIPAARPGTRNGFEITMLATSLAEDVQSVDDVGVRGELAAILYSFEPSQNF